MDLLPQRQSDAQTHTAGTFHRTPGASPQACGIGAPAPHMDAPYFHLAPVPRCRLPANSHHVSK